MTPLFATAPKAMWYFTRGSGAVTLVLLTVSFLLGVLTLLGWATQETPRMIVQGLHRNVSLLVMVFLGLHIATSVIDGFVPLRWIDAVVPFISVYRPIWLGLGAIAFDLLIAVVITSLLRVRVGYQVWKVVHWTSYACWPLALVHGLGSGSDARQRWLQILTAICLLSVLVAVGWRLAVRRPSSVRARGVAFGTFVLAPVAIVIWVLTGPMQTGWGRVHKTRAAAVSTSPLATGFTAPWQGTVSRLDPADNGDVVLQIAADLAPATGAGIAIRLQGQPTSAGGLVMHQGEVDLGPSDDPTQWTGTVTSYTGGRLLASVTDVSGARLALTVDVRLQAASAASGTVTATPSGASS